MKKTLCIVLSLFLFLTALPMGLIPAFSARPAAYKEAPRKAPDDGPHLEFDVGECTNGTVSVAFRLVDCVGLTTGDLKMSYDGSAISGITKKTGKDAKAIGDIYNPFYFEANVTGNPVGMGFYFYDSLWDSAAWQEAAEQEGYDQFVNGENFEFAVFDFTVSQSAEIGVTGKLKFGGETLAIDTGFTIEAESAAAVRPGDVDGDGKITAADARSALRRAADLEEFPAGSNYFIACDVDGDTVVTGADARLILRGALGLEKLPDTPVSDGHPEETVPGDSLLAFDVGEYQNGKVKVAMRFTDCVGLTSGDLRMSYDSNAITNIEKRNGTDAKAIGGLWANSFNAELNSSADPAPFVFYFKESLWDSAAWQEAADEEDCDDSPNGENFEAAVFTFTVQETSAVTVTGTMRINGTSYSVSESFTVLCEEIPTEPTTEEPTSAVPVVTEPHVEFDVGAYRNGTAAVAMRFVGCVGLTSGSLKMSYDDSAVTGISRKTGKDAKAIGDIYNPLSSEFNGAVNPAEYGFYFKESLWDSATWKEEADEAGNNQYVNGENFEAAVFNFTVDQTTTVNYTAELKIDGTSLMVTGQFTISCEEPTTVEPTTAEPTTAEPTTVEPTTAEPATEKPLPSKQHVEYDVGEYVDGKVKVALRFVYCVGLTSGSLKFAYEDGTVTQISRSNGKDAKAIFDSDIDNAFSAEFNSKINPAEYGFYFKNSLWDSAVWKEAAEENGKDQYVNGENFEFAVLTFTIPEQAVITVTGDLHFGDTVIAVNDSFTLGALPEPARLRGDTDNDGAITAADARLTLRATLDLEVLEQEDFAAADVYRDDVLCAEDARWILRAATGLEEITDEPISEEPTIIAPAPMVPGDGGPHIEFDVGEYENGAVPVAMRFVNCVGLTSGDFSFTYDGEAVSGVAQTPGRDAAETADQDNVFTAELNGDANPAKYGCYFKNELWDSAQWRTAANKPVSDTFINGENFEFAVFTFSISAPVEINVKGTYNVNGTLYGDFDTFTIKPTVRGDVDGDDSLTAADARLALRTAAWLEELPDDAFKAADVYKDGAVSAVDARWISRASVKLEDPAIQPVKEEIEDDNASFACEVSVVTATDAEKPYNLTLNVYGKNAGSLGYVDMTIDCPEETGNFSEAVRSEEAQKLGFFSEAGDAEYKGGRNVYFSGYCQDKLGTDDKVLLGSFLFAASAPDGAFNVTVNDCNITDLKTTQTVAHTHTVGEPVTENSVPSTCAVAGTYDEVTYCTECGVELSREAKTYPLDDNAHAYGDWVPGDAENHQKICANDPTHVLTEQHAWDEGVVTKEPTYTAAGEKTFTCSVCKDTKTEPIDPLPPLVATDEKTHITVSYTDESYTEEITVKTETIEEKQVTVSVLKKTYKSTTVIDISTYVKDKAVQPNAPVTVAMPLPQGYDAKTTEVYHIDENKKATKLEIVIDGNVISFETPGFSYYVIVDTATEVKFELGKVDTDERISPSDARLALRASVGLETYQPFTREFSAADIDNDGRITSADARMILRAAVGLEKLQ